jgi:LPXTG-site transpeptidase (sortase) family protein
MTRTLAAAPHAARHRRQVRRTGDRIFALISELLIIAGALTGLYVLWSGWWTDIAAVGRQRSLVEKLGHADPDGVGRPHHEAPPALSDDPESGTVFASMYVPRFGSDYARPVGEGIGRAEVLNTIGLGHYPGTALPGGVGNFAVAGHRVTYGKPLNQIATLQPGDQIIVRATDARKHLDVWYVYTVTGSQIVTPDRVDTIAAVPNQPGVAPSETDRWLTLTACHPMWSAAERYITHAKLDHWMPASDGAPAAIVEATA